MARPILRLNMAQVSIPAVATVQELIAIADGAPKPQKKKAPRKPPPDTGPRPPWGIDFFGTVQWSGVRPAVLCGAVKPLALGISPLLLERVTEGQHVNLRRCIRHYTSSLPYLDALTAEGAMRHDVEGNPVEPVSDEHRAFGREQAKATPEWIKARRPTN
ncbi:ProQ/FINO family protein [Paracoccus litorisediminis]|uniref:ProQ/FINO family protein n=1 Tax=Paracoccus litorisediminis TaxID=2006130 RepID=UPI00372E63AC